VCVCVCMYISFIFPSILLFLFLYLPLILSKFPYNLPPIFPSSSLFCFLPLTSHLTQNVPCDRRRYILAVLYEQTNITIQYRHQVFCRVLDASRGLRKIAKSDYKILPLLTALWKRKNGAVQTPAPTVEWFNWYGWPRQVFPSPATVLPTPAHVVV
jgi:hypothetical protein